MFYFFKNQNERRESGGSAFIEIQYCKLKRETDLNKIKDFHSVQNWQDDSLYVHAEDIDDFFLEYGDIFQGVDCYGINYFPPAQLKEIIAKTEIRKPSDYAALLKWLKRASDFNGVYILGI